MKIYDPLIAKVLNSLKNVHVNSIYNLAAELVRVHWKRHNLIESSIKELYEHQIWNFMT
jgi:hypothetical protein